MTNSTLAAFSDELAALAAAGASSVVQVIGARRPASGIVHGPDTIITTARAIGREDGLRVRLPDDTAMDADLAGWDPASGLAVLRTRTAVALAAPALADTEPRTGAIVIALARSWSNALTASTGNVAVVGGPLTTGRRRQITRVLRITAPMHDGFAGGPVLDTTGRLAGVATSSVIRGYGVAIPADIAWASAARVMTDGTPRRGFIGVAVQTVELPASQRVEGRERGLIVLGVTAGSPAERAGVLVGDLFLEVGGRRTESPDDLLDVLADGEVGRDIVVRALRGGNPHDIHMTVAAGRDA